MRPDRAEVVADRVVGDLVARHRAHAPAREEPRTEEVPRDRLGLVLVDDPAPEQMADVGRDRVHRPLLAVECKREAVDPLDPEVAVEALLQLVRLPLQPCGQFRIAPDLAREPRAASLRVVDVALDLAHGARRRRERAVAVDDRGVRVLPALVVEPRLRVPALVLDVAIAVEVAVAVDPLEPRARLALEAPHEIGVGGPPFVLVEDDEEERCRVDRAVVGRVRALLEGGELPEAELVQDLPRLGVSERVVALRLEEGERHERRLREVGDERKGLVARDQAVPAEERHEPGKARGRNRLPFPQHGGVEAQRGQVDQAARVDVFERAPGGLERGRARQPFLQARGAFGLRLDVPVAVARTLERVGIAGQRRDDLEAGAPPGVRFDPDAERDALLVELGLAGGRADPRLADVALARIAQDEATFLDVLRARPLLLHRILHLEQVGEVGARLHAHLDLDRLAAVVHDRQVFVEAVADEALPQNRDGRVGVDRPGSAHEEELRGGVLDVVGRERRAGPRRRASASTSRGSACRGRRAPGGRSATHRRRHCGR